MKEIATQIEINAPIGKVWQVLADIESWQRWNPLIRGEGVPREGGRIRIEVGMPGHKPMRFSPRIVRRKEELELRWRGRLLLPGLFDGEHGFLLTAIGVRQCHLEHWERFSGVLVPYLLKEKELKLGFTAMNRALKREVEKGGAV